MLIYDLFCDLQSSGIHRYPLTLLRGAVLINADHVLRVSLLFSCDQQHVSLFVLSQLSCDPQHVSLLCLFVPSQLSFVSCCADSPAPLPYSSPPSLQLLLLFSWVRAEMVGLLGQAALLLILLAPAAPAKPPGFLETAKPPGFAVVVQARTPMAGFLALLDRILGLVG